MVNMTVLPPQPAASDFSASAGEDADAAGGSESTAALRALLDRAKQLPGTAGGNGM